MKNLACNRQHNKFLNIDANYSDTMATGGNNAQWHVSINNNYSKCVLDKKTNHFDC